MTSLGSVPHGSEASPLIPAGTIVAGRYRVIARLGKGGMGVTYRAWDLESQRPVVLKHPRPEMLSKSGFCERFSREARVMAALAHPHVVPVTKVGDHEGMPFFVMPFLPGGSLSHRRLRDSAGQPRPMHPSTLHLWLPQLAAAIDYVHASGIVHRDVKPANVFFDAFWHAHLGDFGIAKIVSDSGAIDRDQTLTATSLAIGTQEYMAPELFAPDVAVDARADQYALAVIAYDMLAGRKPFSGESAHIIVEITTRSVPPLVGLRSHLPVSLDQAIARALAKRRDERFESCGAFVATALADVPRIEDDLEKARLLCPACESIIKINPGKVGRNGLEGRCKRCSNKMRVAPDMSALWLGHEETGVAVAPMAFLAPHENVYSLWQDVEPDADQEMVPTDVPRGEAMRWIPGVATAVLVAALMFTEAVFVSRYVAAKLGQQIEELTVELEAAEARIHDLEAAGEILGVEPSSIPAGLSAGS
jgi:predicted Zn finger-like uncharacterized protein